MTVIPSEHVTKNVCITTVMHIENKPYLLGALCH